MFKISKSSVIILILLLTSISVSGTEFTLVSGDNQILSHYPFHLNFYQSISQNIIPTELHNLEPSVIHSLHFFKTFNFNVLNKHYKIWLGETDWDYFDQENKWVDYENFTLIFDGYIDFLGNNNTIEIDFLQHFEYTGGNLVVMFHKTLVEGTYSNAHIVCNQYEPGDNIATTLTSTEYDPDIDLDPASIDIENSTFQRTNIFVSMNLEYSDKFHLLNPPNSIFGSSGFSYAYLSWMPPSGSQEGTEILGYRIYRDGTLLNNELFTGTNFSDNTVKNSETYSYQIAAVYSDGESNKSHEIVITIEGTEDPFGEVLPKQHSMTIIGDVYIDNMGANNGDVLAAYSIVGDEEYLLGKSNVFYWHDKSITQLLINFENSGQEIFFRLWDSIENEILYVNQTLTAVSNEIIGSWPDNLFEITASSSIELNINLSEGWNLISFNTSFENPMTHLIFESIYNNLVQIKNDEAVYTPGFPYNDLLFINSTDGFWVKVDEDVILTISGIPLPVDTEINLEEGWNLVGYTLNHPLDVEVALIGIIDELIQVKNAQEFYTPGSDMNTLNELVSLSGYFIKVENDCSLVYGFAGRQISSNLNPGFTQGKNNTFKPAKSTSSMTVIAKLEFDNLIISESSKLLAFSNNKLVGVNNLWEIDNEYYVQILINSCNQTNIVDFKLFDNDKIYNLNTSLSFQSGAIIGDYTKNDFFLINDEFHDENDSIVPDQSGINKIYPNPFNPVTNIEFSLEKAGIVVIEIFNIHGQRVIVLTEDTFSEGTHILSWDGKDSNGNILGSGLYFCRMIANSKISAKKVLLLK